MRKRGERGGAALRRETIILDGKACAAALREKIASEARRDALVPHLAILLVGEDPASHVYVRNKMAAAEKAGFRASLFKLPENAAQSDLMELIRARGEAEEIDGILLQLPLPDHLDKGEALRAIPPGKDVDGLTPVNAGLLAQGARGGFAPCTPLGCVRLAKKARPSLEGMEALVVGRSELVGRPLAALLLRENCTVTVAHSRSGDLREGGFGGLAPQKNQGGRKAAYRLGGGVGKKLFRMKRSEMRKSDPPPNRPC